MATKKTLRQLPKTSDVWEVGMIHRRHEEDGVVALGLLIATERNSGITRLLAPVLEVTGPAHLLRDAFLDPDPPARPGRPRAMVFDDPWLLDQVQDLLAEAAIADATIGAISAVDNAVANTLQQAGAPPAPGIDADHMAWRTALQGFIRLAPWEQISKDVPVRFAGGELDGAMASITGPPDQIIGVNLYEAETTSVSLMLEPKRDLSEDELERCMRVGLQLSPGLYPRVYMLSEAGLSGASLEAQRRMLLAVRLLVEAGGTGSATLDGVTVTVG